MKTLLVALALVLSAGFANAGKMDKVLLKDGSIVSGKITGDDGKAITVEDHWRKKTVLPYDDIDPRTLFRLKIGKTKRSDGPGQLEVASFACDIGLWAQSRKHYNWALIADESLESEVEAGLQRLRDRAGASVLAQARQAAASGDVDKAQELLTTIIRELPGEPSAEEAAIELARIQPQARTMDLQTYRSKVTPRIQNLLAPARVHYEQMLEQRGKGQSSLLYGDKAVPHFQSALQAGNRARRMWTQIKQQNRNDRQLSELVAFIDQTLDNNLVEIHMQLANMRMDRKQYQQALKQVDAALRISPSNGRAASLRQKIQHNSKVTSEFKQQQRKQQEYQRSLNQYYMYEDYYAYGRWQRGRRRRYHRRNN